MKYTIRGGFTMVELMIVVVILAILSTVGFIAYEDYIVDTRDSKRLAQMTGIRDALRLQITQSQLPLPDTPVEIRNNGTPFLYQGYAGKSVLEYISFTEGSSDPKDDFYYTYLLSENKNDFQLLSFQEKYNPEIISFFPQSYAAVNYQRRHPLTMGKKLGILLEQNTNIPLQELPPFVSSGYIDIGTDASGKLFDAYITDRYLLSGTGGALSGIIPYTTCKKILEVGDSRGNGIYIVNPTGVNPFPVYCLMESSVDGGGWTLIARSVQDYVGTDTEFGWAVKRGDLYDDSLPYSLGNESKELVFSELMWGTYTQGKDIILPINKMKVNKSELITQNPVSVLAASGCFPETGESVCRNNWYWGNFTNTGGLYHITSKYNWFHRGLNYKQLAAAPAETPLAGLPGIVFVR